MKKDIILAGVGGQGILSIATVIGYIAVNDDLYLKQAEVHGMSQRGGDVSSHLRISDKYIASDLIPKGKADLIISVEPMESLRYIPWLNKNGWIITNNKAYVNIPNYPEKEIIYKDIKDFGNHVLFNAEELGKEAGSSKSANIVILGAASPFLGFEPKKYEVALNYIFGKKGDKIVKMNIDAFYLGREASKEFHNISIWLLVMI